MIPNGFQYLSRPIRDPIHLVATTAGDDERFAGTLHGGSWQPPFLDRISQMNIDMAHPADLTHRGNAGGEISHCALDSAECELGVGGVDVAQSQMCVCVDESRQHRLPRHVYLACVVRDHGVRATLRNSAVLNDYCRGRTNSSYEYVGTDESHWVRVHDSESLPKFVRWYCNGSS